MPRSAVKISWDKKFAAAFEGRKFRIMTEVSGNSNDGKFNYDRGAFTVLEGAPARTPLGHAVRHGYLVIEVRGGSDVGVAMSWGRAALARAHRQYRSLTPDTVERLGLLPAIP